MLLSEILAHTNRQVDMERLARMFMAHYLNRCLHYLPDRLGNLKTDPTGLLDFPGAMLRDVFPNRKGLSKFDATMQQFIKAVGTLRLGVGRKIDNTHAHYKDGGPHGQKEIVLFIDKKDWLTFQETMVSNNRILEWPLRTMLDTRRHSLVHELQHAYDDWASKGKFRENPRSKAASLSRWQDHDDAMRAKLYLNNPIEISARYRDTVSELGSMVTDPWKEYFVRFQMKFQGWYGLSDDDKRRLTQRLAAYWISQHKPQSRDWTADVKDFTAKLRTKYGGYVYLHYATNRNAVTIDSFGTDDPATKREILNHVIRFANNRRAMVATGDMKFDKDKKELGFVNQRTRNRDYALPLNTTMYRPARQPMRAAS
jgi:hypothetical protein